MGGGGPSMPYPFDTLLYFTLRYCTLRDFIIFYVPLLYFTLGCAPPSHPVIRGSVAKSVRFLPAGSGKEKNWSRLLAPVSGSSSYNKVEIHVPGLRFHWFSLLDPDPGEIFQLKTKYAWKL